MDVQTSICYAPEYYIGPNLEGKSQFRLVGRGGTYFTKYEPNPTSGCTADADQLIYILVMRVFFDERGFALWLVTKRLAGQYLSAQSNRLRIKVVFKD
jgi:hypothetical protein